jgi:hypothetical protein
VLKRINPVPSPSVQQPVQQCSSQQPYSDSNNRNSDSD